MIKKTNIYLFCCCALLATVCTAGDLPRFNSVFNQPFPPVTRQLLLEDSDEGQKFIDMSPDLSGKPELSLKKALMLSILLPGAGEYYAGSKFKGQVFMGLEATIWTGFIAYRVFGSWKKDDYKKYAGAYAGVSNSGQDDAFYDMVGFYDSREVYNQFGRLYYTDRPYYPDNYVYNWQWQSESNRLQFKKLKSASQTAFRNATFMIGIALLNRVVSAIDTYRTVKSARKTAKSLTQFGEYHLSVSPRLFAENPRISFSITRQF